MIKVGQLSSLSLPPLFAASFESILRKLTWPTSKYFVKNSKIFPIPLKQKAYHTHLIKIVEKRSFTSKLTNYLQNNLTPSRPSIEKFESKHKSFCSLATELGQSNLVPMGSKFNFYHFDDF